MNTDAPWKYFCWEKISFHFKDKRNPNCLAWVDEILIFSFRKDIKQITYQILDLFVHSSRNIFQILFFGKLGVVRVLSGQWGFTRPSSIYFSLGIVRDIVPLFIAWYGSVIFFLGVCIPVCPSISLCLQAYLKSLLLSL